MPHRAEVIAGPEAGVGDADDAIAIASEYRHAWPPAAILRTISHIGGECRALVADHRETPAATGGKLALHIGLVWAGDGKRRPVGDVWIHTVEPISPQRAVHA